MVDVFIEEGNKLTFQLTERGRELLENIKSQMCDDYCRFPRDGVEHLDLFESYCANCPLNKLEAEDADEE